MQLIVHSYLEQANHDPGKPLLKTIKHYLGIDAENVSHAEKLVATLGGLVGIFLIADISYQVTGATGAAMIVPSMGASAVLLFAVPHGRLSQPWALFGGQLISAFVGVSCYLLVANVYLAAGLAVGLAIGAMHLTRCLHPPGGATALAAVIGGPTIHQLGYSYLVSPILLNTTIIFLCAVVFNSLFPWRRYPARMMRFTDTPADKTDSATPRIEKKYLEQAMSEMDMVVDITTEDLQQLYTHALQYAEKHRLSTHEIKLGHYYTNGKHGTDWCVRQILDESDSPDPKNDLVIYRVVEGHGLHSAGSCPRQEFANWAVREVFPNAQNNTA